MEELSKKTQTQSTSFQCEEERKETVYHNTEDGVIYLWCQEMDFMMGPTLFGARLYVFDAFGRHLSTREADVDYNEPAADIYDFIAHHGNIAQQINVPFCVFKEHHELLTKHFAANQLHYSCIPRDLWRICMDYLPDFLFLSSPISSQNYDYSTDPSRRYTLPSGLAYVV